MPTWFWLSPTSKAICRFGTPSAASRTMRARCATRREACSPCALRSSSRLSSFVMRSAGTIRMALPPVFPQSPVPTAAVLLLSPHQCRTERLHQCRLVLLQPAQARGLRLGYLDETRHHPVRPAVVAAVAAGEAVGEGRYQPVDPGQPLRPEDDRQGGDLTRRQAVDLVVGRHDVGTTVEVEPARHPGEGFQGGGQVDGPQVVAGALEARQPVGRPTRSVPVEDDSGAPEPTMDHEAGKGGPAGGEQFGHPDVLAPQVRSGTPETSAPVGVEVPTGEACERLE